MTPSPRFDSMHSAFHRQGVRRRPAGASILARAALLGSTALLPGALLVAGSAPASATAPTFASVCTGLGVTLPAAAMVGHATDGLLGGTVDTALNPVIDSINNSMTMALSGQTLDVGVIDPATHSLASPASCNVSVNTIQVTAPQGISLGGGMLGGLGSPASLAATATDVSSIALGNGASTPLGITNAVALGTGAAANVSNSLALGAGSTALRGALTNYSAYGLSAAQNAVGEVAVGAAGQERQLTHVAAGSAPTDGVNLAQLQGTATTLGTGLVSALGSGSFNSATGQITAPTFTLLGTSYSSVGSALGAVNAALTGLQNGTGISTFVSTNLAQAAAPVATGANALAGGFGASASGLASTVVGNGASDAGTANATVLGNGAQIASGLAGSNVALGQGSVAAGGARPSYAAFGLSGAQSAVGEVAVGAAGAARQVTNVAPGAAGTDAVDVAQLRGTADGLGNGLVAALGSGSYDPTTGQIAAPSFTVGGQTLGTVQGALTALDTAVSSAATNAPVQYSTSAAPTLPHTGAVSNDVTLVGAAPGGVTLHNLSAGVLASDAATVGQMAASSQSLAATLGGGAAYTAATGLVSHPSYTIQGTTYSTVGGALDALQSAVGGVGNQPYFETNSNQAAAQATAPNAVAVGPQAVAAAASAVAIGQGALSSGVNSVALGAGSTDGGQSNVVSVGTAGAERRIVNVLRGTVSADSTDAVTGAQLFETNQAVTQNQQASLANAGAITDLQAGTTGPFRAASTAGDDMPLASGTNAVAGGYGAIASADGATAIGHQVRATSAGATAIGSGAVASGDPTTAVGSYSQATGNEASAFGAYAAASADNATALGRSATASATSATAVGYGAQSSGQNSVAIGAGSTDGGVANVVSVGGVGAERRITNVAAGTLSATSTDAVNGSQLYGTNAAVASLGHAAVRYDTDGSGNTTSSVTLASDEGGPVMIHNLAPGVDAGDAATVGQVQATAAASVQYKMVGGLRTNVVALAGGGAGPVTISNLAAGVAPTDAVNVAQLQATRADALTQSTAYTDTRVNNLAALTQQQIKAVRDESIAGTALALAATGLRYDDRPGKISIGGSASTYRDQMGIAFGIGGTTEDGRYRLNASVTAAPAADKPELGAVVGVSMALN